MPLRPESALYGITDTNSSRHGNDLWGKNQFNSAFPLSVCLLMRDTNVRPVAVFARDGAFASDDARWAMGEVIGDAAREPYYHFEKAFAPYSRFQRSSEDADKIDLVVAFDGAATIPLEVKLTVVPDSSTAAEPMEDWGPEMVMRPVSSAHAMMGLATSLLKRKNRALKGAVTAKLKTAYNSITDWTNAAEVQGSREVLMDSLDSVLRIAEPVQRPFLVQPIWKTQGQSLVLCDHCFDVFAWSDVAVMRIPHSLSQGGHDAISRPFREVARHVRALYDILVSGDYSYRAIYKGMPLGRQTDKSFSIPGHQTRGYLDHPRLRSPHYGRDILSSIVLNNGEKRLKPERRFDAAVLHHMTTDRTKHG